MTPFPRFALRTLPALLLSLGCLAATVQAAEAVRYRFSQAAAPLAQALNAFSRASGQTLLYTAELPPQATAPALHGSLDAEEALQRLLQGSGLRAADRRAHPDPGTDPRQRRARPRCHDGLRRRPGAGLPAGGQRLDQPRRCAGTGNPPGDQRGPGTGAAGPAPAQP